MHTCVESIYGEKEQEG